MIGESQTALYLIKAAIISLRSITPLAFLYTALWLLAPLSLYRHPLLDLSLFSFTTRNPIVWIARAFCANEVWFYFWSMRKIKSYQDSTDRAGLPKEERLKLFEKVIKTVEDPRAFMKGWFAGAPIQSIGRDNLRQWILWAFFNEDADSTLTGVPAEKLKELDYYVNGMEKIIGHTFAPGFNDAITSIRLNYDPVKTVHRPACVYIGVGVLYDFIGWSRYYSLGFRHYVPSSASGHRIRYPYVGLPSRPSNSVLTFWYRPAILKTGESEALPIVFVHGIGAGLKTYREKITQLHKDNPRSAIYLIETPAVTMKFMDKLPSKSEYVQAVADLLHANDHQQALFFGHSLGTVIVSWIVHLKPELCKRVMLIDPVCWLLHLPDVAYNFLHRKPVTATHFLYWYFVSNEPGIARFLGRGFFWFENALWLDEIPKNCQVTNFLSENDMIVDIPNVFRYLTDESIPFSKDLKTGDKVVRKSKSHPNITTCLWKGPGMDHAVYLLMPSTSQDVVDAVNQAIAEASNIPISKR